MTETVTAAGAFCDAHSDLLLEQLCASAVPKDRAAIARERKKDFMVSVVG